MPVQSIKVTHSFCFPCLAGTRVGKPDKKTRALLLNDASQALTHAFFFFFFFLISSIPSAAHQTKPKQKTEGEERGEERERREVAVVAKGVKIKRRVKNPSKALEMCEVTLTYCTFPTVSV